MEINIKKIKKNYYLLNSLIKKYEDIIVNYYGKMNFVTSERNDKNGLKFSEHIDSEKKNIFLLIDNLKSVCSLYDYLIKKYEQFGKNLKFDFNNIYDINNNFSELDLINNINKAKKYNNLDLNLIVDEKEKIINQKDKIVMLQKNVRLLKKNISSTFDMFKEIENEINNKISKIEIVNISETNISDYV